ncbi:hypothetical protein [Mucilaginibacter segetis]|uniref:YD repeat-containing protein n=1 Tax=Mucilaginibacter segetis TaxID=2793071 RepID=A0A934PV45_9SPHI|nr:hypothetical protein [Mucilaginibacter segetis]MBK0379640.1 hypothetical protein [Mucilaginibacter segetis]
MKLLNLRLFIVFIVLLFSATACKKDEPGIVKAASQVTLIKQSALSSGNEVFNKVYTYDDNRHLISSKVLNANGNVSQNTLTTYAYENGRISEVTTKQGDNTLINKYIYDTAGRLIKIQIIPLQYHEIGNGTFVPYNEVSDEYDYNYDSAGKVLRITLTKPLGIYHYREEQYYYDYEYNNNNELTKCIWQEKGDFTGGNTWIIAGATEEIEVDPEVIQFLGYGDLNPIALALVKKLPKSMKMYFNADLHGKVYNEYSYDYKISNNVLESVTSTHIAYNSQSDDIAFTDSYKYDLIY